ncbi:hypothetical protein ACOSQ3_008568 [Xanthoceras sorbifolium]
MEELKKQVEKLTGVREMVQHTVDEAKTQGDEIEKVVEQWLNNVDEFTKGVVKPIIDDEDKAGKLCSIGFLSNLMTRYSLSKKAAKTAKDGIYLLGEGIFQKVSYKDKLFDVVVMAEVTETPDIKIIQGQIADELGLKFHEESLSGRAARLRDRLKKEKKVLVVLDNIWAKLDLDAVGIPFGEEKKESTLQEEEPKRRNDDQRRYKILLTSRSEVVLSNKMDVEKNFLVEILSHEEAGNLFWGIVGDSAKNCDFDPIEAEIVGYCAGLPVAISTVANALKKKKDGCKCILCAIKLSSDFLGSEEAKSLFLLCSLHNASFNISIDYLFRYGMGLCMHALINNLKASSLLLDGSSNKTVKMHDIIHAVAVSIASTHKFMFNEKLPKDSIAISLPYKDVSVLPERLEYPKLKLLFLFIDEFSLRIPDTFFEGVKELKVLDMTTIHMLSLPSSLSKLTNLQTLCLDQCQLKHVASIGELKRLETLCFWGSDVEQLPRQIGQLTRLRLLDLSNCSKLKVISPHVISSLTRLEELYMGNGFIRWEVEGQTNVSHSDLKQLYRLTTLEIHVVDAQIMPQDLLIFEKLERYKILIGDVTLKLKLNNSIHLGYGIKILLNRTEDLYLDELKGVKNILYQLNGEGFPQLKHLHVQNGNVFPMLESLFLHNLINLEKICHGRLAIHLFSFSMVKNLLRLQEIEVCDCKKLEEIVFEEISSVKFTHLRTLRLQCLPQLTSFGLINEFMPDTRSQEILAEDEIGGFMLLFSQNVLLPSLENLKLSSINIKCVWLDQLPAMSFFGTLKFLFSYSMVKHLVRLEQLDTQNCKSIEGIINTDELKGERKVIKMVFPKLINLQLKGLPNLIQFGSGNSLKTFSYAVMSVDINQSKQVEEINCQDDIHPLFEHMVVLPTLASLNLSSIRIQTIWHNQLQPTSSYFQNLTKIIMDGCDTLVRISNTLFPRLYWLHLNHLPEFTTFCKFAGNSIELPSLARLFIKNCPKMHTFVSNSPHADMPPTMEEQMNLEENLYTGIQPFFDEKMDKLRKIWHHQFTSDSFYKIVYFGVHNCHNVLNVFPSIILGRLQKLDKLWLTNCSSLHDIFELQPAVAAQLKKLVLRDLPKLKPVWDMDSQGLLPFQNLLSIHVMGCDSLKSIFPTSVSRNLLHLEKLWVEKCSMVEEIFAEEEEIDEAVPTFPQLTFLRLANLSRLRSFYPRVHISEWPMLKKFQVWNCDKVEMSASKFLSFQVTNGESQHEMPMGQTLLLLDKVPLTNLESLGLDWKWFEKERLHEKLPEFSCKLKFLTFKGFHKRTDICVYCFLHKLPNLEKLQVAGGFFKEVFLCEGLGCDENHVEAPSYKLSQLLLFDLFDSLNLREENSSSSKVFQSREILEVISCSNLKSLVLSCVSFQNLTTLKVIKCKKLLNLEAVKTAECLVQLTILIVVECKMIEEIITCERDEVEDRIIFKKLSYLELKCLPSLTSFYSGNYTIEFPSLEQVILTECPNMKIFS